ncbi:hypothetical protein VDGL01_00613 [Verticillium dahliae]
MAQSTSCIKSPTATSSAVTAATFVSRQPYKSGTKPPSPPNSTRRGLELTSIITPLADLRIPLRPQSIQPPPPPFDTPKRPQRPDPPRTLRHRRLQRAQPMPHPPARLQQPQDPAREVLLPHDAPPHNRQHSAHLGIRILDPVGEPRHERVKDHSDGVKHGTMNVVRRVHEEPRPRPPAVAVAVPAVEPHRRLDHLAARDPARRFVEVACRRRVSVDRGDP